MRRLFSAVPTALVAIALLTAFLSEPAAASAEGYRVTLDAESASISFLLDAVAHKVRGTARLTEGTFAFDPGSGVVDGRFVVDALSMETGNRKRDRDMHRKVLESDDHPEIVFVAERFDGSFSREGTSTLVLHGQMEIVDGSHPLAMDAEVTVEGGELSIAANFVVPYVEWGMRDPSFFLFRVGKTVDVTIEARGELIPASPSESDEDAAPEEDRAGSPGDGEPSSLE